MLPKAISDHNPLKIIFGMKGHVCDHLFHFEKWWLQAEGFEELVRKT
jgi:hypothetical protein